MKKHILLLAITAMALLLAGCLPEGFVWWSPDGETAAVRSSDGLRLSDKNGKLSAVVLPGDIQSAAWMPDGSALVVSRSYNVTNWAAVEKLIPREEVAATLQLARVMPDLLNVGLTASGGSVDQLDDKFLKPLGLAGSHALDPAWSCALNLYRQQISAVISNFPNAAALEAEIQSGQTNGIPIYEITVLAMRDGRPAREPSALDRSLRPLLDPIVSPHFSLVAFRTGEGALKLATLDGQEQMPVADENVAFAAWSTNGRSLIHVVIGKSDKVGEIRSRSVANEEGDLAQGAQAETLALAAFAPDTSPRLSVLPDGRVLFAALPITLPARATGINPAAQFFVLDPAKPDLAPSAVKITDGSLPEDLAGFAPSPDGKFVAVVERGTDGVAVLELATGKVNLISPAHAGWKSRMVPAWRNPRELTFAALPSDKAVRPELKLWQTDGALRVLSKDWPDNIVRAWLEAPGGSNPPGR